MSAIKRYGHHCLLVEGTPEIMKLFPQMFVYVLAADCDRVTAESDALQLRLNAADQRIDEAEDLVRRSIAALEGEGWKQLEADLHRFVQPSTKDAAKADGPLTDEGALPATQRTDEVQFKGMIETGCGNFAVMIDKANAHYGWTFKRHPDGMWVSGRVATPAEMQAAIAHARFTTLQL
ncbi:hypothetical protein [Pseudomonas sp. RT6P73]